MPTIIACRLPSRRIGTAQKANGRAADRTALRVGDLARDSRGGGYSQRAECYDYQFRATRQVRMLPSRATRLNIVLRKKSPFGFGKRNARWTWSGLSAGHVGFRAGVRAGPAVIFALGNQSRTEGIIFDVSAHTLELRLISYPMVRGFVWPKRSGPFQAL